jgi:hypothetical protein
MVRDAPASAVENVARKVSGQFTAPVIDADLDGPVPWLATAYVAGPSLADAVAERGPLPVRSLGRLADRSSDPERRSALARNQCVKD